jgi:hypothetical protein
MHTAHDGPFGNDKGLGEMPRWHYHLAPPQLQEAIWA